jgi:hypothetical protein
VDVVEPKTHFEQVPVAVVKKIVKKKPRREKRAVSKPQRDTNNERKKN